MAKKIVVTGGSGRFGSLLKKIKTKDIVFFPDKKQLNILDYKNILKYLNKKKPKIYNVGRFKANCFNYPDIDVIFKTEARLDEKIYDIINEMNNHTQEKVYELTDSKIKYLYLDRIIFEDKNITVEDAYNKNKIFYLTTYMFNIYSYGAGARLEISLE